MKKTSRLFSWYEKNFAKLFLIIIVFLSIYSLTLLPYSNLTLAFFPSLHYYLAVLTAFFIFKPKQKTLLNIALCLFVIAIPFAVIHLPQVNEIIGNSIYLLLAIYIIRQLAK